MDRYRAYVHIFSAIGPRKAFVTIKENGETAGLASVVAERGWAGIFNVVIDPVHRRKGAAQQLMRILAEWAASNGANEMYLQVVCANAPAVSLYRKLGFHAISKHHYRVLKHDTGS
ncbi:GNAT family N-acetyltransferase [Paenibacillus alkalitolerans]|uniref:GNAT family N-acetyltransferase n=1 Tax=Paenibacillus alkalitolerans TaxID=2799335 RepID=UPI0018F30380|nr:GNAT family N-acetyltransferase [Paenibacillus alkalitolerans]